MGEGLVTGAGKKGHLQESRQATANYTIEEHVSPLETIN